MPQTELTFPLHFGLCEQQQQQQPQPQQQQQQQRHDDFGRPEVGASAALSPRAERVARVQLSEDQWHAGRPVPAPSAGYHYSAHLCMTLPESPPNEAAGMFDVSLLLEAAGGASPLLQTSRPIVLRFKSQLLRWLWLADPHPNRKPKPKPKPKPHPHPYP